jgi:hypothetical protein
MGYSRVVLFAVRPIVIEQIRPVFEDEIWEVYDSPGTNPITVVHNDGNTPSCTNGLRISSANVSDRDKICPLHELLQRFLGTKYMTSRDPSQVSV